MAPPSSRLTPSGSQPRNSLIFNQPDTDHTPIQYQLMGMRTAAPSTTGMTVSPATLSSTFVSNPIRAISREPVSLPIDPQQAFSKPTSRAPIDSASAEAGFESNSSYRDPTVDNSLPTLSTSDELQSDKPTQSVMTAMPPPKTNQQFKSIPNRQNSDRNDSFLVSTSSNGDKNDDNSDNNDNNGRGGWNPPSDSFQHSFTQRERDANDDDGTGLPSATMAATTRTTATLPFKSAFSSPPSTVQNAAGRTASPFDGPRTPFQATTRPSSLFASPPAPNQTSRTATSQNRGASDDFALPTQSTATTTNNNNDNVGQMPDDNNDNDQNTGTFAETFAPPRSTNGGSFLTNLTSTRQSFKSTPLSRLFNPAVVPDDRFVRPLADPLVKLRPKQSVTDSTESSSISGSRTSNFQSPNPTCRPR